ncbi:hypothetical protein NC652_025730 [Populus alba x Populus x berolinensis]|nr:hypothetical protein NC652_025730 [Populus alba x Populus x berolinensis]
MIIFIPMSIYSFVFLFLFSFAFMSSRKKRGEDISSRNQTRLADLGKLHQPVPVSLHDDAVDLSSRNSASLTTSVFFLFVLKNKNSGGSIFCLKSGNVTVVSHNLSYAAALNTSIGSAEIATTGAGRLDTGQYMYQKGTGFDSSLGNGQTNENWGDSGMADNSLQTDTSTDVNTDDKNQAGTRPFLNHSLSTQTGSRHWGVFNLSSPEYEISSLLLRGVPHGADMVVNSMDQSKGRTSDQKTLRRLAQNCEAARRGRLRKKEIMIETRESTPDAQQHLFKRNFIRKIVLFHPYPSSLKATIFANFTAGIFLLHLDFVGIMAIQWMEMVRDLDIPKWIQVLMLSTAECLFPQMVLNRL